MKKQKPLMTGVNFDIGQRPVKTGRKGLKCIGKHTDGLFIFEPEKPNKYLCHIHYWVNYHKARFQYWSLNINFSEYGSKHITPSMFPNKPKNTVIDLGNGTTTAVLDGLLYSLDSICRLEKYGVWPTDQEVVRKRDVKIIKILLLDKKLAQSGSDDLFYYERYPQEVAIYTGKISGGFKEYNVGPITKRYRLEELASMRGDLVLLKENERITLGCVPIEKSNFYLSLAEGERPASFEEVYENNGMKYLILSASISYSSNGCHSPIGGAANGDYCGCKSCDEFMNSTKD